mgnify:FL=1
MPQQIANLEVKNFQSGLRTEFSPINGSINAASSWDNFKLKLDGSIEVRDSLVTANAVTTPFPTDDLPVM